MNIRQIENSISLSPKLKNDPTAENYIALFHAITDTRERDIRYYLSGLFDDEEGDERVAEIDELRKRGDVTKAQMIKMNEDNKKYDDIIRKKIEQYKKRQENNNQIRNIKPIKVTNPSAGTEEIYSSIKEFAEEYEYNAKSVSSAFFYQKTNIIQFKGLIIQKLK